MNELDENDTFELVYQIVTGIRRRQNDNDTLGSVLKEISRVTARWQPDTNTSEEKTKVLFALNPETSEWAMAGVDPTEVKSWEMIGFTPSYANRWRAANLALTHALKWSTVWNLTSMDPVDIAKWEYSGTASDPNTVSMWLRTSVTAERAIEWTLAGGNFYNGKDWLSAYPDVDATQLQKTEALGLSLAESRPWIDRKILGDDIETFINKGYTPSTARKYLDSGGTLDELPDKKGTALVVGRSWKRISDIIESNPAITAVVSQNQNTKTIQVELTHKDNQHPITITFHKNGRFSDSETKRSVTHTMYSGKQYTSLRVISMKLNELLTYLQDWK